MQFQLAGTAVSGATNAGTGGGCAELATLDRHSCSACTSRSTDVIRLVWSAMLDDLVDAFALALASVGMSVPVGWRLRCFGGARTAVIGNGVDGTVAALRAHPASATAARQCEADSGASRM